MQAVRFSHVLKFCEKRFIKKNIKGQELHELTSIKYPDPFNFSK